MSKTKYRLELFDKEKRNFNCYKYLNQPFVFPLTVHIPNHIPLNVSILIKIKLFFNIDNIKEYNNEILEIIQNEIVHIDNAPDKNTNARFYICIFP
jgi:hypothetical protein